MAGGDTEDIKMKTIIQGYNAQGRLDEPSPDPAKRDPVTFD